MSTTTHKDTRIDLRAENSQKKLLTYAASIRKVKLSAFILESALKEAEGIIAEKVHFSLSPSKWKEFCAALDAPARNIPELKRLFSEPTVFDE